MNISGEHLTSVQKNNILYDKYGNKKYYCITMDTDWIEEFEKEDKLYEDFYKEPVDIINIYFLYINNENELIHIVEEPHILQNNKLQKETLIGIIRSNRMKDNMTFRLLSLLQYNFTKEPIAIINPSIDTNNTTFLQSIHYLDDVKWEKSISFMRDLNSLFIVYYHDPYNKLTAHTTRKIKLNSSKRRTKRKRT